MMALLGDDGLVARNTSSYHLTTDQIPKWLKPRYSSSINIGKLLEIFLSLTKK